MPSPRGRERLDEDALEGVEEIAQEVKKKKKIIKKIVKRKNADGTEAPPEVTIIEKSTPVESLVAPDATPPKKRVVKKVIVRKKKKEEEPPSAVPEQHPV